MSAHHPSKQAALAGSEADLLGRVLGGSYRIQRVLDRGGMGTVFEAEHVRLRRPVAVKVLSPQLAHDETAGKRFRREAEIISQLQHPHIVSILDFDATEQGELYIVMELLQGEVLTRRLERDGVPEPSEALRIIEQVAAALSAAHAASVVHRDLKPANIFLVQAEGAPPFVKLLDFGISKFSIALPEASGRVTREFDVLGTPDYMAPEQARGKTALVDHRGDQYALAAIAFELLTGSVPFRGDSVLSVLYRVAHLDPPRASETMPGLPAAVDAVLARALAKQPEQRYPSTLEFARALGEALGRPAPIPSWLPEPRRSQPAGARSPIAATMLGPSGTTRPQGSAAAEPITSVRSRPAVSGAVDGSPALPTASTVPPPPEQDLAAAMAPNLSRRELGAARTQPSPVHPPSGPPPAARSLPPGDRSSLPPSIGGRRGVPAAEQVQNAISQARQSLGFENLDLAVDYAQSAIRIAQHSDEPAASQVMQSATNLFERIFALQLGGVSRRIVLRRIPSAGRNQLSPDEAYVLSRVWDGDTVEQLTDVSSLPRWQTLHALVSLMRAGIIETE